MVAWQSARLSSDVCTQLAALPNGYVLPDDHAARSTISRIANLGTEFTLIVRHVQGWNDMTSWHRLGLSGERRAVICLLSSPADYAGGDLEFALEISHPSDVVTGSAARGTVVTFQRNAWHHFTEITSGQLRLLVSL